MSEESPDWATCVAAQLWCKPQHGGKVMDIDLAEDIAIALRQARDLGKTEGRLGERNHGTTKPNK